MAVHVVVKSAVDLPKLDRFSKVDPYCVLTFHEQKTMTRTISNDQSPEWNETFQWTLEVVPGSDECVEVVIMDHETLGKNRAVAKGAVPLSAAIEQGSASLELPLVSPDGETLESKLLVDVTYRVPISAALQKELNEAKKKIEELEELLKKIRAEMVEKEQQFTTQIESLTAELNTIKKAVEEKEEELRASKEENEALKAKLGEAETAAAAQETKLLEAEKENENLKTQLSKAEAKIRQLEGRPAPEPVAAPAPAPATPAPAPATPAATGTDTEELKTENEALKGEVAALKSQVEELRAKEQASTGEGQEREREPLIRERGTRRCCVIS